MKTTFEVGDKVQWNYGAFYGSGNDDWRDGEVAEFDDDDPGLPYKVRVESGATYWCEPGNVRAVPEPDVQGPVDVDGYAVAPEPEVDMSPVIDPAWREGHYRQMALHHAVDLGKAVVASGGHTDAETLVGIARKFEEFLRG